MLKIERVEIGSVTVLRAAGEIDNSAAGMVRNVINGCMADKRYQLALDLSQVVYMEQMGIVALLEGLTQLQKFKGDLKLASMNIQSRRLMSKMCLGHIFESYESEVSAVQGYQQEAA